MYSPPAPEAPVVVTIMLAVPAGIVVSTGAAPEYENETVVLVVAPAGIGPSADMAAPPTIDIPMAATVTVSALMTLAGVLRRSTFACPFRSAWS
jgi:hypothetical protein